MARSLVVSSSYRFVCGVAACASILSACAQPESFHAQPGLNFVPKPVTCQITRSECTTPPSSTGGTIACGGSPQQTFTATACTVFQGSDWAPEETPADACKREFCTATAGDPYSFSSCTVGSALPANLPSVGICTPDTAATKKAMVSFFARARKCDLTSGTCAVETTTDQVCVDVSTQGARARLLPPSDEFMRSVEIIQYAPNTCTTETNRLAFALPPGNFASATAGGTHANVSLVDGFVTLGQSCYGESCSVTSIESLRANVANFTVAGVPVTNVGLEATFAAPITTIPDDGGGHSVVAPGGLKLIVKGKMAGQQVFLRAQNSRDLAVNLGSGGLGLVGTFDFLGLDLAGRPVPVTLSVNVQAPPASAAQLVCADESATEKVFGFESTDAWTSAQASLSLATSPVTQGCEALSVSGQGYMTMVGAPFSTRRVTPNSSLSVDLFIPDHQPNPFWLGALQMYLSCPSGNVNNQYIGQVELTGKPQNRYSTLRFPLPAATSSTLRRSLDDCSVSLALNVNATGRPWLLDNLRFTP